MSKAVLIVYTNPVSPERDAEYNKWYDETHLPEVLGVDGFVAASRYRVSAAQANGVEAPPHRYVSVYEADTEDPQGLLDAMLRGAKDMHISDSCDLRNASAVLWEEITPRVTRA